jgi:hypothetical protein
MSDFFPQLQPANHAKGRAPASRLGSQFDAFLFSPIGDDYNGMPLSVVSILARGDLDPWREAASLAAMPADLAARRLESIIQTLPHQPLTLPDCATVARRLIALLPRQTDPSSGGSEKPAEANKVKAIASNQRAKIVVIILMGLMILLMGAHCARSGNESPTQPAFVTSPGSLQHNH